jgi:hypothetical protein
LLEIYKQSEANKSNSREKRKKKLRKETQKQLISSQSASELKKEEIGD